MLIEGYADLLTADAHTADRAEIQEWSQTLQQASKRLHRLIENYIIYTQIQTAFQVPQELDALRNFIVPNTADIIRKQANKVAEAHDRVDDLQFEIGEVALAISPDNLKKIVMELTDNAFKFSEPGRPVIVGSVREDRTYTLYIKDRGRGMTEEQVENMGAYMQFDRETFEQQGVGLGMSVVQGLVSLHQATMKVRSKPNKGTIVAIRFPI